jgi:homoserine O-acetyltransferase
MKKKVYQHNSEFQLESGEILPQLEIVYHTYGNFSKTSKVIWVCHALTANSDVFDWWNGLFGENCLFNDNDYFIVCANILGSCYGTTGPLSINPISDSPYFHYFPEITVRDIVAAHELLRKHLNINKIHLLTGSSLGGQQALEWSVLNPELFENLVFIASNARHSAWGIAFNQSQRNAIETDSTWKENNPAAGLNGLKTARSIALLSYRHYNIYQKAQTDSDLNKISGFKACSYQDYQGEKLAKRFNAFSYRILANAMDSHNVGRNRGSIENALSKIKAKTLSVGVATDLLFPTEEQKFVASQIQNARYAEIDSLYGHDGFLIETEKLEKVFRKFLKINQGQEVNLFWEAVN